MPNRFTIISAMFSTCLLVSQFACDPGQAAIEEAEPTCGDDRVDLGETCDGNCPDTCDDGNACTLDSMEGSPDTCNAVCSHEPQIQCENGDGCCPAGCNTFLDADCESVCGNAIVEQGETCDPTPTTGLT